MNPTKIILPIIVIAQFCCTSLWFASNAVMSDLVINFGLNENAVGFLTSAVQFGFILGTLVFALLTIADRFSPSKVFLISALFGAIFNAGIIWDGNNLTSILILRFLTGFFLAGIYPVGMKIATDYFEKGLGKSLGFLVGALVLGTAFPHLLKGITNGFPWKAVLFTTSSLAILGGLMMVFLVPDGPYRKQSQGINLSAFFNVFKNQNLRAAAFGYFGHMWELYAFWAFTPLLLKTYSNLHHEASFNISVLSFTIIGIGGLACVLSGYLSQIFGVKNIAFISLFLSCICCLICPLLFTQASEGFFITFLIFWGMVVVADSPLLSTLVAQNAPAEIKGTALTIVNCIGFAITILSIQLISLLKNTIDTTFIFGFLAIGPFLGLLALSKKTKL
ncbi:MFS transporter [Flavobacterium cellulosilyticum]|uniref:MFS transporter n=1 Tax=Flavobacterium cellulosilyticum TaxID=2541731 RepID=A0A4R5CAY0_9FLAO|nr:MFS transporter [Flavobacterium cellulosilyticum]TDD97098.1 MFS transporter [Flavobacterium cellulosilyticum]